MSAGDETSDDRGYELIDCGEQEKLERFGDIVLRRPSSSSVWARAHRKRWRDAHGVFRRDSRGFGTWMTHDDVLTRAWRIQFCGFDWTLRTNDHGNVGIFAEQRDCWRWIQKCVRGHRGTAEVLNLFAYTGGSSLAAAAAGARVVHLDASKTSVAIARENATNSGLGDRPIRWITDDAVKFVDREIRRQRRYQGIVLDPPSYGRGTGGQVWEIESHVLGLIDKCLALLDDSSFLLLTSHSPGFTPLVLENLIQAPSSAKVESGEMVIEGEHCRPLPSGSYARWWHA